MNSGNHKELINIIHDNATFHSPVVFTPQEGKKKVIKYLSSAVEIFKERNFYYTDNIITDNISFYAEFKARFNKIEVNGNQRVSSETIKMFANVSLGNNFDNNNLNTTLKK